jgi:3-dehydroquinate synthase
MIRIPIEAAAGRYDVLVGRGLIASTGALLRDAGLEGELRLISDEQVFGLHGGELEAALRSDGYRVASYRIAPGEVSKSLEAAAGIYDWLVETGTERRDVVLALGGGVVGDLAGFAAATFLRGIRLVQIPTSLLAQVDSSVGGKVAVNHPRGKNLIGAFYPPSLVIVDSGALSSLPPRELSAALAEVVKMGVILDPQLFELLEREAEALLGLEPALVERVVARSIELKAGVVQDDEREAGLRAILNYGHTIGHGIEAASDYSAYRHGEAVAIGMEGVSRLAEEMGLCPRELPERQGNLLRRFGLPLSYRGIGAGAILEAMSRDKKATRGRLTWILPERIGKVVIRRDVPESLVERVVAGLAG